MLNWANITVHMEETGVYQVKQDSRLSADDCGLIGDRHI